MEIVKEENPYKRISSNVFHSREDLMKTFKENVVNQSWDAFANQIERNYSMGKGTVIPSFGVFSFMCSELDMKGTTNERERDLKPREPVFIISKAFCDMAKPGIFINSNILPYMQKQNENISHTKLSFTEIALSIGVSKTEAESIIYNCLKYIAEAIYKVYSYIIQSNNSKIRS